MNQLPGYVIAEKDEVVRAAVRASLTHESSEYLTICEQLRFAWDAVLQLPDEGLAGEIKLDLQEKIIDAFNMGKKMNSRLAYYKKKYNGDSSGSRGSHLVHLTHTKERVLLRSYRNL